MTGQCKLQTNSIDKIEVNGCIINDIPIITNEFNNYFLNVVEQIVSTEVIPPNMDDSVQNNYFSYKYKRSSMFLAPVHESDIITAINN